MRTPLLRMRTPAARKRIHPQARRKIQVPRKRWRMIGAGRRTDPDPVHPGEEVAGEEGGLLPLNQLLEAVVLLPRGEVLLLPLLRRVKAELPRRRKALRREGGDK